MKREKEIIIAAGVGLFAILGIIGLRRFLNSKHNKYQDYYSDFHQLFDQSKYDEEHHGIEFLSMN